MTDQIVWPGNKDFAFTIFDDTDFTTVENVGEVYALLDDLGLRTTKSVWPVRGNDEPLCEGATCEDEEYLRWVKGLASKGFEVGYHMATFHTSDRSQTERALDRFKEHFGEYPSAMASHSGCEENMYWGDARIGGIYRVLYNALTRYRFRNRYRGHVPDDSLFWGDLCRERIKYVRNFVFSEVNTLNACPFMPYHDPSREFVDNWYASSEGPEVNSFLDCLDERNQDRLEEEGGACIMYTHLACGFYSDKQINSRFRELMERLSRKNGWFVPVSTLLDFLRNRNGNHVITDSERSSLERRWLLHKLKVGRS